MNAITALVQKDIRIIYRDRFLLFIAVYALILALVARLGVPWVPVDNLDLYIAPAIVMFGTLLLGTLLGFALIEEREQGTWLLLRVLPLSSRTVFAYFVVSASGLSLVVSFAAAMLYGYPVADWPAFVFMLVASALAAPLVMLALGALAKNKIEGLAISKIISALGILPALVFSPPRRGRSSPCGARCTGCTSACFRRTRATRRDSTLCIGQRTLYGFPGLPR